MTLVDISKLFSWGEDNDNDQIVQSLFCKMFVIGKTICFILAIIFTIIAIITNSQNNTRPVPLPRPFFSRQAWIDDFYEGDLYGALHKSTKYDIIFLMLYAPWDADSQKSRIEFERTCRYFYKKVYCAAINCWQKDTGCKTLFDNLTMYPVFLVDLHNVPSLKYNGEYISSHMIHFLSVIIKPLKRIHSVVEFERLSVFCDVLVLSYVPHFKEYYIYYTAALKYLEYDPQQDVCWSLVTDVNVAKSLNLKSFCIKIFLWNETKEYNENFTYSDIVSWVRDNVQIVSPWVFPINIENTMFPKLLESEPTVILFTPRNMYLDYIPTYSMFKEVAMEYREMCFDIKMNSNKYFSSILVQETLHKYKSWNNLCKNITKLEAKTIVKQVFNLHNKYNYNSMLQTSLNFSNLESEKSYDSFLEKSVNEKIFNEDDDKSADILVLKYILEKCRKFNMSKKIHEYDFHLYSFKYEPNDESINEICNSNSTFNFFAVDSLLYSHFATALGIKLSDFVDRTTVVIFNNKDEETFVLKEHFGSKKVLYEFLKNFTTHTLARWKKSTEDSSKYLNRYKYMDNVSNDFTILELTATTFKSAVYNSSKNVIVYYYTPYCSYCQVSSYIFLSVANLLKNFSHSISFFRVDGDNNDLPWHFVPLNYPSIILFPAESKLESKVFPVSKELTIDSLLEFVLIHVDIEVRLMSMLDECQKYKIIHSYSCEDYKKCIQYVKSYCLHLINDLMDKYLKITNISSTLFNFNFINILNKMRSKLKYLKLFYINVENMKEQLCV